MSLAFFLPIAVALVLAGPRVLLAQDRPVLPPRLQPATRATIERLADSLARESLPTAPLYDKAAEGVLKGADDARVIAAVRGLAQRLRDGRALLGPAATAAELSAAASALHAGAPASSIQRLVEARNERSASGSSGSLGLPLVVLANLIGDGVPAPVAIESLTALMKRGVHDEELSGFRWSVARDIKGGKSPRDAATVVTARLLHAIDSRVKPP
jgi:hypothetical protein